MSAARSRAPAVPPRAGAPMLSVRVGKGDRELRLYVRKWNPKCTPDIVLRLRGAPDKCSEKEVRMLVRKLIETLDRADVYTLYEAGWKATPRGKPKRQLRRLEVGRLRVECGGCAGQSNVHLGDCPRWPR